MLYCPIDSKVPGSQQYVHQPLGKHVCTANRCICQVAFWILLAAARAAARPGKQDLRMQCMIQHFKEAPTARCFSSEARIHSCSKEGLPSAVHSGSCCEPVQSAQQVRELHICLIIELGHSAQHRQECH